MPDNMFFQTLEALVAPSPHSLHYLCTCSTTSLPCHPSTVPPNPSNSQIILVNFSSQAPCTALRSIMSCGGGGVVTTPLSFLTGYTISNGQVALSSDFLAVVLSCKHALALCRDCRLRPHVVLCITPDDLQRLRNRFSAMVRPSSAVQVSTTRLAIEVQTQPTASSIPALFRQESSGVLGTLPSPSLRSMRLNSGVSFMPPGSPSPREKYILASYPRSGNTMIRNILHNLTGTWTGSDTAVSRTLGWRLAEEVRNVPVAQKYAQTTNRLFCSRFARHMASEGHVRGGCDG